MDTSQSFQPGEPKTHHVQSQFAVMGSPTKQVVRILLLFGTALLAYLLFLRFVFPGYIAPPAAYHSDMYWSADFVANGWNFATFLTWPRPVFFETLLLAGHFGFEGSLLFLTAIVLLDFALALALFERFVLQQPIAWWMVLGTLLFAMVGPGFYAQPAFDVGYHLAILFGLLGMYVWESLARRNTIVALALTGIFFALSTLANEGFIPVLFLYAVVAAVRERRSYATAAAVLSLPLIAIALSFADGQLTHSPFIAMHAAKNYPYRIDLSPQSLLYCTQYYVSSLANPAFFALAIVCAVGLWLNRRLPAALVIVVAAFSLYLPYVVLPNHLESLYQWAPMPLLMLVIPLAWTASPGTARRPLMTNAAIVLVLLCAIGFQTTQYRDEKNWYRVVLEQNRNMLAALRSRAPQIARSHAILVRGLTFVTQPWTHNAQFLSRELGFSGEWTVETEPGYAPIESQTNARPIQPNRIHYKDYDLVLDFDTSGKIVSAHR
ncbi:MAG: hypothetical protein ACYDGM_11240 [Vulcanimicrobiaceae bacterium]